MPWPESVNNFYNQMDLVNMNLIQLPGMTVSCIREVLFYEEFRFSTGAPLLFFGAVGVIMTLGYWAEKSLHKGDEIRQTHFVDKCWVFLLYTLFFLYPSVSRTVLMLFNCERLDHAEYYLRADYRIQCGVGQHKQYVNSYGYLAMFVYPIGIPVAFFLLLWRLRTHTAKTSGGMVIPNSGWNYRLLFLYLSYEPSYWWFEAYELVRKLLQTGVIIFVRPRSATQIAAGLSISCVALVMQVAASPFSK